MKEPKLIQLYDGKYSVKNNNGILEVYRHGERCPEKEKQLIGDGFVLSLVQQIEKMKELGKDAANYTREKLNHYNTTPDEWEQFYWLNEWCLNDNEASKNEINDGV